MDYDLSDLSEPKLIPGVDENGHNAPLTVRIPPDWLRMIDVVINDPTICYKNRGDFVLDALFRHFDFIRQYTGRAGAILGKIKAITSLIEEDQLQQGFELTLNKLGQRVEFYKQQGAVKEAARLVLWAIQHVEEMEDGFWKLKFQDTIKEEFGALLKATEKARLIPE